MRARRTRSGWLATLRRFSGVGAVVFAVVFMVGVARAHALALVSGDDELCFAMGFAGRTATPTSDPADLADGSHACCDLSLCLDASTLPPSEPPYVAPRRIVRRRARVRRSVSTTCVRRCGGNRPRGPPTL
ncbi:DUF2946 family protein [Pinisolibacter sp.]|uniref:DUF2946 family protein n=1 Tax=Pinisolibacter sp. TaxID=2172024 RepID=UPI002FDD285C